MKTTLWACAWFAVGGALPALAVASMLAVSRGVPARQAFDDLLLTAYVVMLLTGLFTLGFAVITGASAAWRRLPPRRAATIAAVLGVVAPVTAISGVSLGARLFIPLVRAMPRVEAALVPVVTGAILGAAALVVARVLGRR